MDLPSDSGGLIKPLIIGIAIAFGALVAMEGVARIASTVQDDFSPSSATADESEAWFQYSGTFGWERKSNFRGRVVGIPRAFDESGYNLVDSVQAADRYSRKVLVIGDSNAFGYGVADDETFVEVADRLLDVDFINLGVNGYSSYQGLLVLQKYLPLLQPEAVVISFNFNDRRGVGRDDVDNRAHFEFVHAQLQGVAPRINSVLETSHLYRALRLSLRHIGLLEDAVIPTVNDLRPRVDPEQYRNNLTSIVQQARQSGVRVVFLALGDNPGATRRLREGMERLAASDDQGAIAALAFALRWSDVFFRDLIRLQLAEAYRRTGDTAGADRTLSVGMATSATSLHGGGVLSVDDTYRSIMEEVAQAMGVELVDALPMLAQHPEVFFDICHFDASGHRMVGELLAAEMADHLVVEFSTAR